MVQLDSNSDRLFLEISEIWFDIYNFHIYYFSNLPIKK
jgi:hypothetical protein